MDKRIKTREIVYTYRNGKPYGITIACGDADDPGVIAYLNDITNAFFAPNGSTTDSEYIEYRHGKRDECPPNGDACHVNNYPDGYGHTIYHAGEDAIERLRGAVGAGERESDDVAIGMSDGE